MALINQILRGVVIGIANLIPGVSGGTMLVSMGFYDTLIVSLSRLYSQFKKSMLALLPYLAGTLVGIFTLAGPLAWCFAHAPLPTNTGLVGLILGGVAPIVHRIDKKRLNAAAVLLPVVLFALIVGLALSHPTNVAWRIPANPAQTLVLLVMGAVAGASMLIPGVSGSMVVMLLGYYRPVLNAVTDFTDALFAGSPALAAQQLPVLFPFATGALAGVYLIARGVGWLMRRWPTHTYCAVLGLVAASPIALLLGADMGSVTVAVILLSIATFAAGFAVSAWLSRGARRAPKPAVTPESARDRAAGSPPAQESPESDGPPQG